MPSIGDWRTGADYDYFDELTSEQLTFEFVRRSGEYTASCRALDASVADDATAFSVRWGLRFRGRSGAQRRSGRAGLAPSSRPQLDPPHRDPTRLGRRAISR